MKRGRNNQRRRPGGGNPNRALDSNGPDVRIRGTANQIHDKYQTLARDAQSAGDRVKAENYLQHAEHYFRLMKALQPAPQPQVENADMSSEQPSVGQHREERDTREAKEGREDRDGRDNRGRRSRHANNGRADTGSRPDGPIPDESGEKSNASDSSAPGVEENEAADISEKPSTEIAADGDEKLEADRKPARKRRVRRTTKAVEEKDEAITS